MLSDSIPAATYILLIRHGENEWVSSGRLAGRTAGVHLNDKGRNQSAALVTFLQRQPIHAIYSSPLERCIETAQPLADARTMHLQTEDDLIEVDYGEWMGRDLKELAKQPEWSLVQHYPSTFHFPGGESLRAVQQRAIGAMERICATHPNQVVAVFSHGDVIRTLLAHFTGTALDLFQRVQISTCSVSVVAQFGNHPVVLSVNVLPEMPVFEIKQSVTNEADGK